MQQHLSGYRAKPKPPTIAQWSIITMKGHKFVVMKLADKFRIFQANWQCVLFENILCGVLQNQSIKISLVIIKMGVLKLTIGTGLHIISKIKYIKNENEKSNGMSK